MAAGSHAGRVTDGRTAALLRSHELRLVAGLTLLALALRLAFALALERDGLGFDDMLFYHWTASTLADGKGFIGLEGLPTARWPPAFPFLVSLVYRAFGSNEVNAELLNATLGAATVPLAYLATRRAFDRRVALVAATALALMPGQIMYAESILAEPLYTFVLVGILAMLVCLPDRRLSAVLIGVAIGVAALTRGEGLLLVVVAPVVWWGALPRRELLVRSGLVILAAALAIAPWTVRNAFAVDAFVPVSTNGAQTFWAGHNPAANGSANYTRSEVYAELKGVPPKRFEVEQARLLRREALEYMFEHPLRELTLVPRKLLYLVQGDSRGIQYRPNGAERQVAGGVAPVIVSRPNALDVIGIAADIAWYGLLTLFVLALLLLWPVLWRNTLGRAGIALTALSLVLYGFLLYGNFRYRMPLEPVMIMLAAPLAAGLWERRALLRR